MEKSVVLLAQIQIFMVCSYTHFCISQIMVKILMFKNIFRNSLSLFIKCRPTPWLCWNLTSLFGIGDRLCDSYSWAPIYRLSSILSVFTGLRAALWLRKSLRAVVLESMFELFSYIGAAGSVWTYHILFCLITFYVSDRPLKQPLLHFIWSQHLIILDQQDYTGRAGNT